MNTTVNYFANLFKDENGEHPLWMKIAFYVVPFFSGSILLYFVRYVDKKLADNVKLKRRFSERFFMKGDMFQKETKIDGKVVIVTGANSGIGKETAIELARRGGKVYLACRDTKKGEEALKEVKKISKSDKVQFLQLDLASLDSVRDFSKKFHELETKLHILVNNAGVMMCPKALTKDGFEMHFGINHIGHFLLTNLLLDLLKASSPSRVVVVSGLAHKWGVINKEDLNSQCAYSRIKAYCHSKLANNLFTHELNKKLQGTGVTVNSLHPGIVPVNIVKRFIDTAALRFFLEPLVQTFFNTPQEGAQTTVAVAVDPEFEKVSGKYFFNLKEDQASAESSNDELSSWLWKKSEELVGLSFV